MDTTQMRLGTVTQLDTSRMLARVQFLSAEKASQEVALVAVSVLSCLYISSLCAFLFWCVSDIRS
jgi:hypothetical protein